MQLEDSLRIAKALADSSRLQVMSALLPGERCAEELSELLGLAPSTISFHLKKLISAGLVQSRKEQYYAIYAIRPQVLGWRLQDLISFANPEEEQQRLRQEREARKVLETFFTAGRLTRMPSQKRKRMTVLEALASLFETAGDYDETEVNSRILPVFDDYCLVRRLLVDEGFLSRSGGRYRRSEKPSRELPDSMRTSTASGEGSKAGVKGHQKDLKRAYLLEGRRPGIFRVRNKETGRTLLGASLDARAALNRVEFELGRGTSRFPDLLADFEKAGREGFDWEILESLPAETEDGQVERELDRLEERHLAALDWENTYNPPGSARIPPKRKERARGA